MNQLPPENELRARVAANLNDFKATCQLGELLRLRGDFQNAEVHARNAVRLNPNQAESQKLLGLVFSQTNRNPAGEHHLRKAIELSQPNGLLITSLALNLSAQGRYEEAAQYYNQALQLEPQNFRFLIAQANSAELNNNLNEAWELLDRAEQSNPGLIEIVMVRADVLSRKKQYAEALEILEAAQKKAEANKQQLPSYYLRKGKLLDKLERYEEAFEACVQAKQQTREQKMAYQGAQTRSFHERLRNFFNRDRMSLFPPASLRQQEAQPLFIIGFPRSGTTLTEQILASHSEVKAGGELFAMDRICNASKNILASPLNYPECLIESIQGDKLWAFEMLRDLYLQESKLSGDTESESRFFTDKTPFNGPHLGLIKLLFPQSPIIQVVRHPLDSVLSTYFTQMDHGAGMAYDLKTIAEHYVLVDDLIDSFCRDMDLNHLQVRYEDIIEDQRSTTEAMLKHAGLDWDERCQEFHKHANRSRTASYAQVTEKIYTGSIGRYRNYRKQLEPVVPILNPVIERLGYSVAT